MLMPLIASPSAMAGVPSGNGLRSRMRSRNGLMARLQVDGRPEIRAARAYRPRSPWWRFSSSRAAEGRHAQTLQIDHGDAVPVLPGDLVVGVRLESELSERQIECVEHEETAP